MRSDLALVFSIIPALYLVSCKASEKAGREPQRESLAVPDPHTQVSASPAVESTSSDLGLSGSTLYEAHCALCHGPLQELAANAADFMTLPLPGTNSRALVEALNRVPPMNDLLYKLTSAEIDLIANELQAIPRPVDDPANAELTYLSAVGDAYAPIMQSPIELYQAHCGDSACHASPEQSTIRNRSFSGFAEARQRVPAMQPLESLNQLTRNQIEGLLRALGPQ